MKSKLLILLVFIFIFAHIIQAQTKDSLKFDEFNNTENVDTHKEKQNTETDKFSSGDALIRPKITYDFDDRFSILTGSNNFVGDETGKFEQYEDNLMTYMNLKCSF